MKRKVVFRRFSSDFKSWEDMLSEAAEFATAIGEKNLINISCSEFGQYASRATIIIWYWTDER